MHVGQNTTRRRRARERDVIALIVTSGPSIRSASVFPPGCNVSLLPQGLALAA
jgi:hypothetical protein